MRDMRDSDEVWRGLRGDGTLWVGEARFLEGGGPCGVGLVDHECRCRMERMGRAGAKLRGCQHRAGAAKTSGPRHGSSGLPQTLALSRRPKRS